MSCRKTFTIGSDALTCVEAFIVPEIDTHPLYDAWRFFEYGIDITTIQEMHSADPSYESDAVPYPLPVLPPPVDNYYQSLHAVGGTPPYTWFIESGILPEGLSLDSATGLISGFAMPLNPPQINPTHAFLSLAPFGGDRISSYYPVVFRCQDSDGHSAYATKDMFVNWVVRCQGSVNPAPGYVAPDSGTITTPIDASLIPHYSTALGVGSIFKYNKGEGVVEPINFTFDGTSWQADASTFDGEHYVDTEPGTKPIGSLLGTYNLLSGGGFTGSFTLS